MKRAWRFDIAALARHDPYMDRHALERLGHHVVSRRTRRAASARLAATASPHTREELSTKVPHGGTGLSFIEPPM